VNSLCIESLSNFIFVDCLLLFFFLWVGSTCILFCLVLLMDGLLMDGLSSLIFMYRFFLRFEGD